MPYNDASRFSASAGSFGQRLVEASDFPAFHPEPLDEQSNRARNRDPEPAIFHGEALARDPWAERYGAWIVLGFTAGFAFFLLVMVLLGQVPGKSFQLKSFSDILQFVGEGIGFIFCIRIALRLRSISTRLNRELMRRGTEHIAPSELANLRIEAQAAQRSYLAWLFLSIGIALYASGQAVWTSYDVRMNSADVPFPGLYDIGFVGSYIFFLIGTLLLTRRTKATVGRTRLLLDALAVIGAALALSWFFVIGPSIATLTQQPGTGAAFLSIYFPTGDLFLVAVGAFLMFSPLAHRAQQSVFLLLCMGLFFLAITDSLLAYYSLSLSFNTGTLQDVLWPLSLCLVGLAAVEYPRSVAREQEQTERAQNPALASLLTSRRVSVSQLSMTAQTIAPFLLALATCALLLTVVAPRGGATLLQADLVALALIIIIVARQALTLLENNRLTLQMRGELVISRRELQVTRREADEATRSADEKRVLEEGVAALRSVHARVARGDFSARAPTVSGPLLPIAISLNLMLDRLSALSQRGSRLDQLSNECKLLQEAVERMGQGLSPWPSNQPAPQSNTELRSIFMGLAHLQRVQEGQWRRSGSTLESMSNLTRRLRETLHEMRNSNLFSENGQASYERMTLERVLREVDLLEQQQRTMLSQVAQISSQREPSASPAQSSELAEAESNPKPVAVKHAVRQERERLGHAQYDRQNVYDHRAFQSHHVFKAPMEE